MGAASVTTAWQADAVTSGPTSTTPTSTTPTPRRPDVRGVEVYTRWSLLAVSASEVLLVALAVAGARLGDAAGWLLAVGLLHTASAVWVLDTGLQPELPRRRWRRAVATLAVATVLAVVVIAARVPTVHGEPGSVLYQPRASLIAVVAMFTVGALATRLRLRWLVLAAVSSCVVTLLAHHDDLVVPLVAAAVALAFAVLGFAGSYRVSVWILAVVRELEEARRSDALLAVAQERLRIARDIHDVVGRALSVVAVKSDLAATLQRRGDARAEGEMLEVRQVAQESLAQVRAVVSGYREVDLVTELAGARALLGSAGVTTTVTGSADGVADADRAVLGAVVREAVTNVVRHSRARRCTFELSPHALVVRNDGVVTTPAGDPEDVRPGNGLTGLSERLEAVGGRLELAREPGGWFELRAVLPAGPGPAGPWPAGPRTSGSGTFEGERA
ncbi:sensor histidine kinase [Serinibacter arcticus]|uniref:Sensor histidine kinase n=1 Tax=Serinibacter arcticus TaxID=1655435 RepID=A0A2U1ZY42_9MICO|nr:histidine kinase [Serinibacter arcticus]PWD51860.1 sensor histidine kinase [Serinibacter arcticus]